MVCTVAILTVQQEACMQSVTMRIACNAAGKVSTAHAWQPSNAPCITRTYWISLHSMAQAEVAVLSDGEKQQWQAAGNECMHCNSRYSNRTCCSSCRSGSGIARLSRHIMQQWPVGLSGLQLTLLLPLLLFNRVTVASGTEWGGCTAHGCIHS